MLLLGLEGKTVEADMITRFRGRGSVVFDQGQESQGYRNSAQFRGSLAFKSRPLSTLSAFWERAQVPLFQLGQSLFHGDRSQVEMGHFAAFAGGLLAVPV